MNWREIIAWAFMGFLCATAALYVNDARAGIVMQYETQGRTIDVYVIPEQRTLRLVDRYRREVLIEHQYSEARIDKDEALHFYCYVARPGGLSGLLVCD